MPPMVPFMVLMMGLLAACAASPERVTPEDMTAADHAQTEHGKIDRIFLELIRSALADERCEVWRDPESEMMPEMIPDPGSEMFLDLLGESIQQHEMQRLMERLEASPYGAM